jgi:hypothetical protein
LIWLWPIGDGFIATLRTLNGVRDFTPTDIAQYVDVPSGWDGTKNSITLIDEATNTIVSATGGQAY